MLEQEIIGQTGLMGQQVVNVNHPLRLAHRVVFRRAFVENFDIFKGRNEFGNRVGQLDDGFFIKLHNRHRSNRLGHGINAENCAVIKGKAAFKSAVALMAQQRDFALARHRYGNTGKFLTLQIRVEIGRHGLKAGPVKAQLLAIFKHIIGHYYFPP